VSQVEERWREAPREAPGALATRARGAQLSRLERDRFDLIVIGGGISGVGVAREAALRGLSVALLEARDFAAGTSSRSTKLIHGGLRYLAMGDFALVRDTCRERKAIHRLAPHLCEPRNMVVPARSWLELAKVRIGVTLYERLGQVERAERHQIWSRAEIEAEEPLLDSGRHARACVYREYTTDDAHLTLANARDAVRWGAVLVNHTRVDALLLEDGLAAGVEAECQQSGRKLRVRGRAVINAAGPWIDALRRLEDPSAPPLLHLARGVHIVVQASRLPVRNLLFLTAPDGRPVFAIRHADCTYLGTTDTSHPAGAELWPQVEPADVEYLIETAARSLRGQRLTARDVVAAWSGLRPLIAVPGVATSKLSRREAIVLGPARLLTLAGGKLTGYRTMARECVEAAARSFGLTLAPPPREESPLPGGDFAGDLGPLAAALAREAGLAPARAERLVRLYGSEARAVAARGSAELAPGSLALRGEVDWAVDVLGAATLEDVLYRRVRSALYDVAAREATVAPIAARMRELLGWNEARERSEIAAARQRLANDLAFRGE
jgi:glycerol-3-phosphate dehydrogenase